MGGIFWLLFVFFFASSLWGQETTYPEGYNISVTYTIPELIIETGNPMIITWTITNNESYPLANLYLSDNFPPEMELDSCFLNIDGLEIPFVDLGPLEDEILTGCQTFYWMIDDPRNEETINRQLMPGETLNLEYYLSCSISGSYLLPFHTTCFYGDGTGFFATGDSSSVTFTNDPDCGDANNDGEMSIIDIIYIINYKYKSGPSPEPLSSVDVNHDGLINIIDIIYLINFLYKSGPEPNCP